MTQARADVKFHVLGPLSVTDGPSSLAMGGPKQRVVLAMLLANVGKPVSADAIEFAVYGDDSLERGRRVVQTYVSTLRSVLGDLIQRNGPGWVIDLPIDAVDASLFEELYQSAQDRPPEQAAETLRQALALWRGSAYADVEAHGMLDGEVTRLAQLRLGCYQARFDSDLASGRDQEIVGDIEPLLAEEPLQEKFRAQHMLALYRAGRQADALRSFTQFRRDLADELGLEPSPELRSLEQRILEQDPSLLLPSRAEGRSTDRTSDLSTLPTPATRFIGREVEIDRIQSMLSSSRLVTLTGVGGCGKTRLAIEVAERERSERDGEVYFADLSLVSEPDDVVLATADAIDLPYGPGDQLRRVMNYLADSKALLVLDNCEHVIQGCVAFATAVLGQQGVWRILATSREMLAVDGEQNMPVPPMPTDGDESAIELFEARAKALNPDLVVDYGVRAKVAELCERLDGLPLAIELAAARSLVMSPSELLSRLNEGLGVLSSSRSREQHARPTLKATIDWSYRLLDADEQRLLSVLGVFRGLFDVTAAASVAGVEVGTATDLLESLVAKSLVVPEAYDDRRCFRLLDTIRHYARQLLRDDDRMEETQDRHLEYYLTAVVGTNHDEWPWLRPNIEAAIDVAIDRERYDLAADLFSTQGSLWHEVPSLISTLARLDTVMSRLPSGSPVIERLRLPELQLALGLRDFARLSTATAAAIEADDEETRVAGLILRANGLTLIDPDEALRLATAAEKLDSSAGTWGVTKVRADVHMFAGEYGPALELWQPYVEERVEYALMSAATILLLDERPAEALELMAEMKPPWVAGAPRPRVLRGFCYLDLDRRSAAESEFLAEARLARRGREFLAANDALIGLSALAAYDGDVPLATELVLGAGEGRWLLTCALGRRVADRLGVRDAYDARLPQSFSEEADDATELLRATMAAGRW